MWSNLLFLACLLLRRADGYKLPASIAKLRQPDLPIKPGEWRRCSGQYATWKGHDAKWSCEVTSGWSWRGQGNLSADPVRDIITSIGWLHLADVHFGETVRPNFFPQGYFSWWSDAFPGCLQPGTIVGVDLDHIDQFTRNVLPQVYVPIIVLSSNGDGAFPGTPGSFTDEAVRELFRDTEKSQYIIHWFSTNCEFGPDGWADRPRDRVTCLPLGAGFWHRELETIARVWNNLAGPRLGSIPTHPSKRRNHSLVFSFAHHGGTGDKPGYHGERGSLWQSGCVDKLWGADLVLCHEQKVSLQQYYRHVAGSKFVVSPTGRGPDSHRTVEALLLGAYPIVKTSARDAAYHGLPVLIVQDWHNISSELLDRTFRLFRRTQWEYKKLFLGYWARRIRQLRPAPDARTCRFRYVDLPGEYWPVPFQGVNETGMVKISADTAEQVERYG
eukprot:g34877.t1